MDTLTSLTTTNNGLPRKSLRPCLSPVRSGSTSYPSSATTSTSTSRSVSTSSACSFILDSEGRWVKHTKSVRWQGEMEGCAVTAYHHTWSATEYDRTPLEPPSEAERACMLPARGARCLSSPSLDCDGQLDDPSEHAISSTYLNLPPSPTSSPNSEPDDDSNLISEIGSRGWFDEPSSTIIPEEESEECDDKTDDEWSECVERRRLMFARMCHQNLNPQPEFEGYRSLSATLVELLRSVETEGNGRDTPDNTENEDESDTDTDTDLPDQYDRFRTPSASSIESTGPRSPGRMLFRTISLQDITPDGSEGTTDEDPEIDTPSLVSSASSEVDSTSVTPQKSNIAPGLALLSPLLEKTDIGSGEELDLAGLAL